MAFATLLAVIAAGMFVLVVYLVWRVISAYELIARLRRRIKKMEGADQD